MPQRSDHLARLACAALLLLLHGAGASAQEKTLHWRQLDVVAHLDRDGLLRISERQVMIFNGDWNGGERRFSLRLGQNLDFYGISRLSGAAKHPLTEGDLDQVGEWKWHDSSTLRWRSRHPNDEPFKNAEIVYLLEYTISNVLTRVEDEYVLRHEFAFPQRDGIIEKLTVRFTFDEVWSPVSPPRQRFELVNLPPGESATIETRFRYALASPPSGIDRTVPAPITWALAAFLVAAVGLMCFRNLDSQSKAGVFKPLIPPEQITEAWLKENLFRYPPEVVGATWDKTTSSAEVAAILARMTAEGKLAARIEPRGLLRKEELHLTLLVPRKNLTGYEASLIGALFVSGDETSTQLIREHYRKRGFDPASTVRSSLDRLSRGLVRSTGKKKRRNEGSWKGDLLMALSAILVLICTAFTPKQNVVGAAAVSGIIMVFLIFGVIGANIYQGRITHMRLSTLLYLIPIFLLTTALCIFIVVAPLHVPLSIVLLTGLVMLALVVVKFVLRFAQAPDLDEAQELRRRFAAARDYFRLQLEKRDPALRDEWFPYLLAFGLGRRVDGWFRAYGGARTSSSAFASSSGSSGSGTSGWTGGGGSFGGAGATGSWAMAAGAMAAGVSSPGSSGGGSGGGGSSGGGGGGGW